MRKATAAPCNADGCLELHRHPSGYCHLHRHLATVRGASSTDLVHYVPQKLPDFQQIHSLLRPSLRDEGCVVDLPVGVPVEKTQQMQNEPEPVGLVPDVCNVRSVLGAGKSHIAHAQKICNLGEHSFVEIILGCTDLPTADNKELWEVGHFIVVTRWLPGGQLGEPGFTSDAFMGQPGGSWQEVFRTETVGGTRSPSFSLMFVVRDVQRPAGPAQGERSLGSTADPLLRMCVYRTNNEDSSKETIIAHTVIGIASCSLLELLAGSRKFGHLSMPLLSATDVTTNSRLWLRAQRRLPPTQAQFQARKCIAQSYAFFTTAPRQLTIKSTGDGTESTTSTASENLPPTYAKHTGRLHFVREEMWLPNCFTVPKHFCRLRIARLRKAEAAASFETPKLHRETSKIQHEQMDGLYQQQRQHQEQQRLVLLSERKKTLILHKRRLLQVYMECHVLYLLCERKATPKVNKVSENGADDQRSNPTVSSRAINPKSTLRRRVAGKDPESEAELLFKPSKQKKSAILRFVPCNLWVQSVRYLGHPSPLRAPVYSVQGNTSTQVSSEAEDVRPLAVAETKTNLFQRELAWRFCHTSCSHDTSNIEKLLLKAAEKSNARPGVSSARAFEHAVLSGYEYAVVREGPMLYAGRKEHQMLYFHLLVRRKRQYPDTMNKLNRTNDPTSGAVVGFTLLASKMQNGQYKVQPSMCVSLSRSVQVTVSRSYDGTRQHGFCIASRTGGLLPLAQGAGVGYVGGVDGDEKRIIASQTEKAERTMVILTPTVWERDEWMKDLQRACSSGDHASGATGYSSLNTAYDGADESFAPVHSRNYDDDRVPSRVDGGCANQAGSSSFSSILDVADARVTAPLGSTAPVWEQNKDVQNCAVCEKKFTLTRRKHHCRQCGRVVCDSCSKQRKMLTVVGGGKTISVGIGGSSGKGKASVAKPERVCDSCLKGDSDTMFSNPGMIMEAVKNVSKHTGAKISGTRGGGRHSVLPDYDSDSDNDESSSEAKFDASKPQLPTIRSEGNLELDPGNETVLPSVPPAIPPSIIPLTGAQIATSTTPQESSTLKSDDKLAVGRDSDGFQSLPATSINHNVSVYPNELVSVLCTAGCPAAGPLGFKGGGIRQMRLALREHNKTLCNLQSALRQHEAELLEMTRMEKALSTAVQEHPGGDKEGKEEKRQLLKESKDVKATVKKLHTKGHKVQQQRLNLCAQIDEMGYALEERCDLVHCQALTLAVSSFCVYVEQQCSLSARLGSTSNGLRLLTKVGFLVHFEGLLSTIWKELGMLGDFDAGVKYINGLGFRLLPFDEESRTSGHIQDPIGDNSKIQQHITVKELRETMPTADAGSISETISSKEYETETSSEPTESSEAGDFPTMIVELLIPMHMYELLTPELQHGTSAAFVPVTAILFNQGINEMQSLADSTGRGDAAMQHDINAESFKLLSEFYYRWRITKEQLGPLGKDNRRAPPSQTNAGLNSAYDHAHAQMDDMKVSRPTPSLTDLDALLLDIQMLLHGWGSYKKQKQVELLRNVSRFCSLLEVTGRITCCKSGKDRTGFSSTLEQHQNLVSYAIGSCSRSSLDLMRIHGTRRSNLIANTGKDSYAINKLQYRFLPEMYKPPNSTYAANES